MGMPEKPQNGMNIAPDGTVYEVLEDGSIRRIGKVSSNGEFEPFGEQRNSFVVRDSILYPIINGKEQRIGRLLPDGRIKPVSSEIWVCPKCGTKDNDNEFCPKCGFKKPERVGKTKRKYKTAILVLVLVLLASGLLWNLYLTASVNTSRVSWNSFSEFKSDIISKNEEVLLQLNKLESQNVMILKRLDEVEAWQKKEKKRIFGNLTWSERSKEKMTWEAAKKFCENLTESGYSDWRLPGINELRTLIQNHSGTQIGGTCNFSAKAGESFSGSLNKDCSGRSRNNFSNFSKLQDRSYLWSSNYGFADEAWRVEFDNGGVFTRSKSNTAYVRCVR